MTNQPRPNAPGLVRFIESAACELLLVELLKWPGRAWSTGLGRRCGLRVRGGLIRKAIRRTPRLGNQLVDRDVPGDMPNCHHGDLLARVDPNNPARPII